jgi:5'-AMP-activated protein kinase, catalytic alpha subunit
MPNFLSPNAQDMINLILQPDPTKRYTIADIRNHPWYNQVVHAPPYTPAIYLGKEPIPIDTKILSVLERDHKIDLAKAEIEI